jgi:hypothetical protein
MTNKTSFATPAWLIRTPGLVVFVALLTAFAVFA